MPSNNNGLYLPTQRLHKAAHKMYIVYNASYCCIVTGYQKFKCGCQNCQLPYGQRTHRRL